MSIQVLKYQWPGLGSSWVCFQDAHFSNVHMSLMLCVCIRRVLWGHLEVRAGHSGGSAALCGHRVCGDEAGAGMAEMADKHADEWLLCQQNLLQTAPPAGPVGQPRPGETQSPF